MGEKRTTRQEPIDSREALLRVSAMVENIPQITKLDCSPLVVHERSLRVGNRNNQAPICKAHAGELPLIA
jgi:hypothetical protein